MPPADSSPEATIRYLTRLLSAIALRTRNQELRIPQALLSQLAGEGHARALFEDYDSKTEEVVLRFRSKSLATYLVEEPIACPTTAPLATTSTPGKSRLPLTDQQLSQVEQRIRKEQLLREIKRDQQESQQGAMGPSRQPLPFFNR